MNKALKCNPFTTAAGFVIYGIAGWHLINVHQLDALLMALFAMGTGLIAAKDSSTTCDTCNPPKDEGK